MQIEAAVARLAGAKLSLETIEIEDPRDDEIRVRVVAAGICHTDLVVRDGVLPTPLPVVLGHEGAGIVEAAGSRVSKVRPGDRVVMSFDSCGHCPSCRDHHAFYCRDFFARNFLASRPDGSSALSKDGERIGSHFFGQSCFATHAICREMNVVKAPDDVPLELLGPLACGMQTGAGAVINALKVEAGRSFTVIGAGSVGLAALMAAKAVGATTLIAVDLNEDRLAMAEALGATHTINPRGIDMTDAIMSITGAGAHYALETTGIASVIRSAVLALAPRGSCGVLGVSPIGSEIVLDEVHFMTGGRRLMGIVEGESQPDTFIPRLIELHRRGNFPFDRLVTFYPLAEINQAITDSENGTAIKPIVRMP